MVLDLQRPVSLDEQLAGEAHARFELEGLIVALEVVGIPEHYAIDIQREARYRSGDFTRGGRIVDEVLDEIGRFAPGICALEVAVARELATERHREFIGLGRSQSVFEEDVRRGDISGDGHVVGQIESGLEVEALAVRADIPVHHLCRISNVAGAAERALSEPARIACVRRLRHGLAVAQDVEADAETWHQRVGVGGDDASSGLAPDALVAHADIRGDALARRPTVLPVERKRVDVERCTARRNPVRDARRRLHRVGRVAVTKWDRLTVAANDWPPAGRQVIGVDDVAG